MVHIWYKELTSFNDLQPSISFQLSFIHFESISTGKDLKRSFKYFENTQKCHFLRIAVKLAPFDVFLISTERPTSLLTLDNTSLCILNDFENATLG